jgi:hypothetical protein
MTRENTEVLLNEGQATRILSMARDGVTVTSEKTAPKKIP